MSDHRTPDAPGLWKAAHGGYGVMFHDDGEPAMLLFGPGAKVRALDAIGPYTRLQPGVPVGSAPVPNLPGLWMDKDGSLYFLSDGRRVSTTAMTSIAACPCPVVPVNGCNRSPTFN